MEPISQTIPSPETIQLRRIADATEAILSELRIVFADDLAVSEPAPGGEELAFATPEDRAAWVEAVSRDGDTCRFCSTTVVWVGEGRRAFMVETGSSDIGRVVACRDCAMTYTETPDDAKFDVTSPPPRPTYTQHSAELLREAGVEIHPSDVRPAQSARP